MSAFIQIATTVLASNTDLIAYGSAKTSVYSLDFCNTTNSDITLSVWWENAAGNVSRYLLKTETVPALGTLSWRGSIILGASGEKIQAIAGATGIDALGAALES